MKRKPDETFEQYKARRLAERLVDNAHLRGKMKFLSRTPPFKDKDGKMKYKYRTYTKGKDGVR